MRVHEASERFGGMIRTTPVELPGGGSLVIDEAAESGPAQYDGDFWGLYLVVEQMDGAVVSAFVRARRP